MRRPVSHLVPVLCVGIISGCDPFCILKWVVRGWRLHRGCGAWSSRILPLWRNLLRELISFLRFVRSSFCSTFRRSWFVVLCSSLDSESARNYKKDIYIRTEWNIYILSYNELLMLVIIYNWSEYIALFCFTKLLVHYIRNNQFSYL